MRRVIAIVGAQGTGKTTLAAELRAALRAEGHDLAVMAGSTAEALVLQRGHALCLLSAIDLECRHEPEREQIDALLRASLARAGIGYSVIAGTGAARLASALSAVRHLLFAPTAADEERANPRWQWFCERCGDADCERHLLARS